MATEVGSAYVTLIPSARGFASKMQSDLSGQMAAAGKTSGDQLASSVDKTSSSKWGGIAKKAGLALGAAGIYGAVSFTKNAIGLEASFGKTMNVLQATTDAPKKDMKALSALALKMGADTVFSANDASNAMLELARGGMTAAQIKAGALKSTMTLAAAGQLDMGEAANYVVKAMGQFGLKAKDSGKIAAALAGAANASTASVHDLGFALSAGGLAAKSVGFSLQETTGILAAFANNGLQGSDAGTSLKTMLDRLQPSTKKQGEAFQALGLFSSKTGSAFVKANGQFKSAAQIAQLLHDHTKNLGDAQRKQAITAMFGSDAQRAATILAKEGAKGLVPLIKATSDQGAAEKQAAANMKGTAGAIEARKGSVETLGLAFGTAIKPITIFANRLIASVANKAVPVVQHLGDQFRQLIHRAGGMDAITKKVTSVFSGMFRTIKHLDFASLGDGLKKALGSVKNIDLSGTGKGFRQLGQAVKGIDWKAVKQGFGKGTSDTFKVTGVLVGFLARHLGTLARFLPALIVGFLAFKAAQAANNVISIARIPLLAAEVVANLALASSNRALVSVRRQELAASLEQNGAEKVGILTRLRSAAATVISTVAQKVAAGAAKAWAAAQWLLNAAMDANPIGLVVIAIAALVAGIIIAYKKSETFRAIVAKMGEVAVKVWHAITTAFGKVKTAISNAISWVIKWVKGHWPLLLGIFLGPFGLLAGLLIKHWSKIKAVVTKGVTAVVNYVKGMPSRFMANLRALGSLLSSFFSTIWNKAHDVVANGVDRVVAFVKAMPGRLLRLGALFASAGRSIIGKFVDGLRNAAGIVSGIAGNVWDAVRGMINGAIDKINGALNFTIHLPGPDLNVHVGNIPHLLASGGRVTGATLAVIGEGREAESVLPDSLLRGLLEDVHAHGAGQAQAGGVAHLTITNWREGTGYLRLIADGSVADEARFRRHLGSMNA